MYNFKFEMAWGFSEELDDYDDHIASTKEFTLTALHLNEEDSETECAYLTGRYFDCTKIRRDLWSFVDEEYEEDSNYWVLFNENSEYADEIQNKTFLTEPIKLMLLHKGIVNRAHRGKGLGLKMLSDLADAFENEVDLFAMFPSPLQFRDRENAEFAISDFAAQDEKTALDKLVSIYSSAGFMTVGLTIPIKDGLDAPAMIKTVHSDSF